MVAWRYDIALAGAAVAISGWPSSMSGRCDESNVARQEWVGGAAGGGGAEQEGEKTSPSASHLQLGQPR